jgi:hypothetical protein
MGFALRAPATLHEGNINLALFVDEKATQQQRDELVEIASGQAGGNPFEIIASLVTHLSGPHFVPLEFDIECRNSNARMGDAVSMAFKPIKNPVSGEAESTHVEHETGFLFKGAEVASASECRASVGGMDFS